MSVHRRVDRRAAFVEPDGYVLADRCALKNTHAIMFRSPYLVRQQRAGDKYALARVFGLVIILACSTWHSARSEDPTTPAAKAGLCVRSAFRVIVDVGHTVDVPGADSARGATEYSFNLQLADVIKQALVDAGFDKTVRLITATAPWPGLVERANRANSAHADLFISIHHDSVPDHLLETWQYEGKENHYSDRFPGYALFISNDNADRRGSLAFGQLLGNELQKRGLHYTPHYTLPLMGRYRHELLDAEAGVYRYDQLVVLRNTLMPAVLLEAGSIVNRQEELELAKPDRRLLVAEAVTAAVEDFCAVHAEPAAVRQVKRPAGQAH
jgi:N-acetylmuramoyl-L-alanine amidase